jgi:hypothetical protein
VPAAERSINQALAFERVDEFLVVEFSAKREKRAELFRVALLVLKVLLLLALAGGAVYILIHPPAAF